MYRFKKGTLAVRWARDPDRVAGKTLVYYFPDKPDGGMLCHAFENLDIGHGRSFAEELEARGYDLTTLQFTIRKKVE